MDRGAWQAAVPGVTRVRHDLGTKSPHHHDEVRDLGIQQGWYLKT